MQGHAESLGHGRIDLHLDLSGSPRLLRSDGSEVDGLRKKDLALITYLWVNGPKRHQRSALASLLWSNRDELKARHSLTQALRRIQSVLGDRMRIGQNEVEWRTPAPTAIQLLKLVGQAVDDVGEDCAQRVFLNGFFVGSGGQTFDAWAEHQRDNLRTCLSRNCQTLGREAELAGNWERALNLAKCAASLDQFDEEAHRRIMRAWAQLGQKARALKHFRHLTELLKYELDASPDPQTLRLYNDLIKETRPGSQP